MRILIADDDATSRIMLKSVLAKLGHECLVAADGTRAWALLADGGIDVLLTDWMMPGLDGPELCRRVRQELPGRYVYIVLITGLGEPDKVLAGMSAGADDYLIKPVHPFAVQTRLIAAQRVTMLHQQVLDFRSQLEQANVELLGRSLTDPLTGLGNRRRMDEDLVATHTRAQRTGRPYGIVLYDIDHFKLYNDHYGHLAGDDTLRRVARCLNNASRSGESVYRYGGEEFLLLLPDSNPEETNAAAARLQQAVTNTALAHDARPTPPRLVTLSGGAACWTPGSHLSTPDLLQHADQHLYAAKSAGRNLIHPETLHPAAPLRTVRSVQGTGA